LTQRELASESGVSLSLIRKLEQGEREDTRLETVRRLAVALRVPTTRLVAASHDENGDTDTVDRWKPVRRALLTPVSADDLVLTLAAKVPTAGLRPTSNNRNRHLLDVANAHTRTRTRQYAEAIDILSGIRATAPQWLPNQRYARDIMSRIIARRRTLTPEMRALADTVGVPM
jgi:transcriptional regulator with XRE-family HTH domain